MCEFKGRRRDVWGRYYTELFFLDEFTALAAGHRPCFECRRAEAEAFRAAFASARMSAPELDVRLQEERLSGRCKRVHDVEIASLPDGAMIAREGRALLVEGERLLPWSFGGYGEPIGREARGRVDTLTPPSILRAMEAGYVPRPRATHD